MATPRGAEHRDVEQRLRNLENELSRLRTSVLGQRKLEVSEGDFAVSGGGSIVVQAPGDLIIRDAGGTQLFSALDGPVRVAVANGATGGQNFPGAGVWGTFNTQTIAVPAGFTRALVFALATVGATASGAGPAAWKVRPVIAGIPEPNDGVAGTIGATLAASWACGFSASLSGLSGSFDVSVQGAQAAGSSFAGGSVNGHITAIALFLR